jgi:lipopolysaccharide export system permease protein
VLVTLVGLIINLWVQPLCYRTMRQVLFEARSDLAATLVREGEFTEPAPGVTVYTQTIDGQGLMRNLFIHQTKPNGAATTYTADQGRLTKRFGRPVLIMREGSTQEFSRNGVLNYLTFDEYIFDLSPLTDTPERVHYKPSDRYLHELFFPDLSQAWEQHNRKGLLAEGHSRLASPLYNVAFMAMALAAIIGGGFSRLGYGRRIAVMAGYATLTRIIGFVVQAACDDNVWLNVLQYAVPLGAMGLALYSIFRRRTGKPALWRRVLPGKLSGAAA